MTTTGGQIGAGVGAGLGIAAAIIFPPAAGITFPVLYSAFGLGASIGVTLGSLIDPPEAEFDKSIPPPEELQLSDSRRDLPVPVAYGTVLVPGNLILLATEATNEVVVGQQVTGSGKSRTRTPIIELQYRASYAVAISEGPIQSVITAYRDGADLEELRDDYWVWTRGLPAETIPTAYLAGNIVDPVPHSNTAKWVYDGSLGRVNKIPGHNFLIKGIDVRWYTNWPYEAGKINWLNNGDFEDSEVSILNWTTFGDIEPELRSDYSYTGTQSVSLKVDGAAGGSPVAAGIYQDIALRRDMTYRLRLGHRNIQGSNDLTITLSQIPELGTEGQYAWDDVSSTWKPVEPGETAPTLTITPGSDWGMSDIFFHVTERAGVLSTAPSTETTKFDGVETFRIRIECADGSVVDTETLLDQISVRDVPEKLSQFVLNEEAQDLSIGGEISFACGSLDPPYSTGYIPYLYTSPQAANEEEIVEIDPSDYDRLRLRVSGISAGDVAHVALYDIAAADYVREANGDILTVDFSTLPSQGLQVQVFDSVDLKRFLTPGRRQYTFYFWSDLGTPTVSLVQEVSFIGEISSRGLARDEVVSTVGLGICNSTTTTAEEEPGSTFHFLAANWLPAGDWECTFYFCGQYTGSGGGTVRLYEHTSYPTGGSVIWSQALSTTATLYSTSITLPTASNRHYRFTVQASGSATVRSGTAWLEFRSTSKPTKVSMYHKLTLYGGELPTVGTTYTAAISRHVHIPTTVQGVDGRQARVFATGRSAAANNFIVALTNPAQGALTPATGTALTFTSTTMRYTASSTPPQIPETGGSGTEVILRNDTPQQSYCPGYFIEYVMDVPNPGTFSALTIDDRQKFVNFDFESTDGPNDFSNWTEITSGGGVVRADTSEQYNETTCARLSSGSGDTDYAGVEQTVTLGRNRRWRVSGWVKRLSGNRQFGIRIASQTSALFFEQDSTSDGDLAKGDWSGSPSDEWNLPVIEPFFSYDWEEGEDFAVGKDFPMTYWSPFVFYFNTRNENLSDEEGYVVSLATKPLVGGDATEVYLDEVRFVEVDESFSPVSELSRLYKPGRTHYEYTTDDFFSMFPETNSFASGGLIRTPRGKGEQRIQSPPHDFPEEFPGYAGYFGTADIAWFIETPQSSQLSELAYAPWGSSRDDVNSWTRYILNESFDDTIECWFWDPVEGSFYSVHRDPVSGPYIYRLTLRDGIAPQEDAFLLSEVLEFTVGSNEVFTHIHSDPEQDVILLATKDTSQPIETRYKVYRLKWNDQFYGDAGTLISEDNPDLFGHLNFYSMITQYRVIDGTVSAGRQYSMDPVSRTNHDDQQWTMMNPSDYDEVYLEVHYSLAGDSAGNTAFANIAIYDAGSDQLLTGTDQQLPETVKLSAGSVHWNYSATPNTNIDNTVPAVFRTANLKSLFPSRGTGSAVNMGTFALDAYVTDSPFTDGLVIFGAYLVGKFTRSEPVEEDFRISVPLGGGTNGARTGVTSYEPVSGAWKFDESDWNETPRFLFWGIFASDSNTQSSIEIALYDETNPASPTLVSAWTAAGTVGGTGRANKTARAGWIGGDTGIAFSDFVARGTGKVYRLYFRDTTGTEDIYPLGFGIEVLYFNQSPTRYPIYVPCGNFGMLTPVPDSTFTGPSTNELHRVSDADYAGTYAVSDRATSGLIWSIETSRRSRVAPSGSVRVLFVYGVGAQLSTTPYIDASTTLTNYYEWPAQNRPLAAVPYSLVLGMAVPREYHAHDVLLAKSVRELSDVFSTTYLLGSFKGPIKGLGAAGDVVYVIDEKGRQVYGFSFEAEGVFFISNRIYPGDSRLEGAVGTFGNITFSHMLQKFMFVSENSGVDILEQFDDYETDTTTLEPRWTLQHENYNSSTTYVGTFKVNSSTRLQLAITSGETNVVNDGARSFAHFYREPKTQNVKISVDLWGIEDALAGSWANRGFAGILCRYDETNRKAYVVGVDNSGATAHKYIIWRIDDLTAAVPTAQKILDQTVTDPWTAGDTLSVTVTNRYDFTLGRTVVDFVLEHNGAAVPSVASVLTDSDQGAITDNKLNGIIVEQAHWNSASIPTFQWDNFQVEDVGLPVTTDWVFGHFHPKDLKNWSYGQSEEGLDVRFEEDGSVGGPLVDIITNERYGMNFPDGFVNVASFEHAAAYCSSLVKVAATTFEQRFQTNYVFASVTNTLDALRALASSFAGYIGWWESKFNCLLERPLVVIFADWDESVIDEGSFVWSEAKEKEVPNYVRVQFTNSLDEWRTDAVAFSDEQAQDQQGAKIPANISAPSITRGSQAFRLAKQSLDSAQANRFLCKGVVPFTQLGVKPGDFVRISWSRAGFVKKLFRVLSTSEEPDDGIGFTAIQYTPEIFQDISQDLQLADIGTGPTLIEEEPVPPLRPVFWDDVPNRLFHFLFAHDDQNDSAIAGFQVYTKDAGVSVQYRPLVDSRETMIGARLFRADDIGLNPLVPILSENGTEVAITQPIGTTIPEGGGKIVISAKCSEYYGERNWLEAQGVDNAKLNPQNYHVHSSNRKVEVINYETYNSATRKFTGLQRGVDGTARVVHTRDRGVAQFAFREYQASSASFRGLHGYSNPGIAPTGSYIILREDGDMIVMGLDRPFDGVCFLFGIATARFGTWVPEGAKPIRFVAEYSAATAPTGAVTPLDDYNNSIGDNNRHGPNTTSPPDIPVTPDLIQKTAGGLTDGITWRKLPGFRDSTGGFQESRRLSTQYRPVMEWEIPRDWYRTQIWDDADSVPLPPNLQNRFLVRIRRTDGPDAADAPRVDIALLFDSPNVAIYPDRAEPLVWEYRQQQAGQEIDLKTVAQGVAGGETLDRFALYSPKTRPG